MIKTKRFLLVFDYINLTSNELYIIFPQNPYDDCFFYNVLEISTNLNSGTQSMNPKTIVQEKLYFISMTLFYSANRNEN